MAGQAGRAAVLGQVSDWAMRNQAASNAASEANMNAANRANEFSAGLGGDVLKSDIQQGQFKAGLNLDTQKLGEQSKQFGAGMRIDESKLGEQSRQFGAGFGLDTRKVDMANDQFNRGLALDEKKLAQSGSQFDKSLEMDSRRLAQQQSQFEADQKFRSTMANTGFTQQKELLALKSSYDSTAEGNRMAVSTWTNTLRNVDAINVSDLEPAAKTQMIKNQFGNAQGSFNLINKLHKIEIPQLLSFE
jgi:hypothetical protein